MKRPSFQFYPADWRKDSALQSCSLEAQGLWINMMCIAHECEPYGHLAVNGKPMVPGQLARLVGLSAKDCCKHLEELEAAGVYSATAEGIIFSRRMVHDEYLRNIRAEAGRLGGNPNLVGKKVKQMVNHTSKQSPTPSSSSSSSEKATPPPRFALPDWLTPESWLSFEAHRVKNRKPMTDRAKELVVIELAKLREQGHAPEAVLDQSIRRGWLDVFPLKGAPALTANGEKRVALDL